MSGVVVWYGDHFMFHSRNFIPSPGRLHHYQPPPVSDTVRIDTGVGQGIDTHTRTQSLR